MRYPSNFLAILVVVSGMIFSSCGTLSGRRQYVKVVTNVDAVQVFEGNHFLGYGPGFFPIKRGRAHALSVIHKKEKRTVALHGEYRWKDSFFANLVAGVILTPIGSVVGAGADFLSGAAWEYEKLERIDFVGGDQLRPPQSIALMPPIYSDELISDEVGAELFFYLREKYPEAKIVPLARNTQILASYDVSHEKFVADDQADQFFRELGTTHIAKSSVLRVKSEPSQESLMVRVEIVDPLRERTIDRFETTLQQQQTATQGSSGWMSVRGVLAGLVPNALGLQGQSGALARFSQSEQNPLYMSLISRNQQRGLFGMSTNLTASNVIGRRTRPGFGFELRLVPGVSVRVESFKVENFEGTVVNPSRTDRWDLFQFGAGLGPEVGLHTMIGYTYLNVIPEATYYWVQGPSRYQVADVPLRMELGHSFFLSDRLHTRLFIQARGYDAKVFNRMGGHRFPEGVARSNEDAIGGFSGVALEYVFPEGRKSVIRWLR
ncbi:MAG: hypothetical protein NDI61_09500 [Bdellovibrionaceae bacterium]|nr:hypothetical protein [Pseudobdellovibrionaceae bacterium]